MYMKTARTERGAFVVGLHKSRYDFLQQYSYRPRHSNQTYTNPSIKRLVYIACGLHLLKAWIMIRPERTVSETTRPCKIMLKFVNIPDTQHIKLTGMGTSGEEKKTTSQET